VKKFARNHGSPTRGFHEIDIQRRQGQRPERKENANAVGTQGFSLGHRGVTTGPRGPIRIPEMSPIMRPSGKRTAGSR